MPEYGNAAYANRCAQCQYFEQKRINMKKDLAPKYLYYFQLIGSIFCLAIISKISKEIMEASFRNDSLLIPSIATTIMWVACFLLVLLTINKFVYITINPNDKSKFIMGNLLSNSHRKAEDLQIVKKLWFNIFKVRVEEKVYFMQLLSK